MAAPLGNFGKKYVDFCGIGSPASAHAQIWLAARRPQEERQARFARDDRLYGFRGLFLIRKLRAFG